MQAGRKKIRVMLVAPTLEIVGGQAVQAQRLLEWLPSSGEAAVDLLPINPRLPFPWRLLQRTKYVRTLVNLAAYCLRMAWRIRHYDLLHVFTASYWSYALWSLPALALARLAGKKIILNYRDGQCEDHLARSLLAVKTIRRMDRVVTPSAYLVEVFARHRINALQIPNIASTAAFHYRERARPRPVFLHNRGLEPLYDVGCTLRAFARIQQRYPEASLTVAHDGPLRWQLEEYAARLGLKNCRFIGTVPPGQVPALYDAHDIYLTSPIYDCFPGSLLECFASGLPVVATSAGGIPYIARDGETALLVPTGDDEALAQAALRLLEEEGLAVRLARAAYQSLQAYSGPLVRDAWIDLYSELLSKQP